MAIGVYFGGRRLIRPQAVTLIDDSGMYARGLAGANTLALIGEATGGEPHKVMWFTDPSYAKSILRSGPLLQAIQRAYSPSSEVNGAYLIAAIRVNPATRGTLILKDGGANPLILLSSVDYGAWVNQIRVRVEAGSHNADPSKEGNKLTVSLGTSYDQKDNVYRRSLFLALSKAGASAGTCTISIGAGSKTLATTTTGGTDLNIDLNNFSTIQNLVDYLDSQVGYESDILTTAPDSEYSIQLDDDAAVNFFAGTVTTLTADYVDVTSTTLTVANSAGFAVGDYICIARVDDSAEETRKIAAVPAGGLTLTIDFPLSTTYVTASKVRHAIILNSDLQAVIDWFNSGETTYVTAAYHASAINRAALAAIPDTYLTGGTEGTTDQADWDACLDLLKVEDVHLISCISYDPAVWASLAAHCEYMSTVGKKERIGFCGGFATVDGYTSGLGKWSSASLVLSSIDKMKNYTEELNSDRMVYVGPGFLAYDENGILTTYSGAMSAALVAGMAAGVDVAEALTHKEINVIGLEYNLRWADLDRLLEGGVCPLEYDPGFGYRVCQSITTWLRNDKYNRRELSVRRVADYVARQVRERLDRDFVGKKGTGSTLISIKNATISILQQMYRLELLAGDQNNPPYKNVQVSLEGDTCWVDFECSPVIPVNYILCTIHLTVYTATLSV